MKNIEHIKKEENKRLADKLNSFNKEEEVLEYLIGYRSVLQGIKSKEYFNGCYDAIEYFKEIHKE